MSLHCFLFLSFMEDADHISFLELLNTADCRDRSQRHYDVAEVLVYSIV
jgi:hypothetical protein